MVTLWRRRTWPRPIGGLAPTLTDNWVSFLLCSRKILKKSEWSHHYREEGIKGEHLQDRIEVGGVGNTRGDYQRRSNQGGGGGYFQGTRGRGGLPDMPGRGTKRSNDDQTQAQPTGYQTSQGTSPGSGYTTNFGTNKRSNFNWNWNLVINRPKIWKSRCLLSYSALKTS